MWTRPFSSLSAFLRFLNPKAVLPEPQRLLLLLKKAEGGDKQAQKRLFEYGRLKLQPPHRAQETLSYAILHAFGELFSFEPGQQKGLPLLIGLLEYWVAEKRNRDDIYGHENWSLLLDLRGPFPNILLKCCSECSTEYACRAEK
ncbi:MAG TPA: hypothetical protein VHK69_03065, partial [Chitinophagaceae bacterium]|nr:hypothetical protein [Chitinophagaceae bacterium]